MSEITTPKDTDLYGKVVDGVIVEFPVHYIHILNRSHPVSWYTKVERAVKPEEPEFYQCRPSYTYKEGVIYESWQIVPLTLDEMLVKIRQEKYPEGLDPFADQPISVADVRPEALARVHDLIVALAEDRMNKFANTRKYDSMDKLCGYKGDPNPKYDNEGSRGIKLRSDTWIALENHEAGVINGSIPIPFSSEDVIPYLPELTWE